MSLTDRSNVAFIAVLAVFAVILHFPGQASVDTIIQLQDGMSRVYDSNQPPAMSLLLSILGFPGMLVLDVLLFALAVAALLKASPQSAARLRFATAFLFLFPVSLLYIGVLWKDVLFAHAAIFSMLLLGAESRSNWKALVLSAIVMAVGTAVRQQGVVAAFVSILYLLAAGGLNFTWSSRWRGALVWTSIYFICSFGIKSAVVASGNTSENKSVEGPIVQLVLYDLGGIASRHPDLRFPASEEAASQMPSDRRPTRELMLDVLSHYSPDRQDHMGEALKNSKMWFSNDALLRDWRASIAKYPLAYVSHRLDVLGWVLGFHEVDKCLPYYTGISPYPEKMVAETGITPGKSDRARVLRSVGDLTSFLFRPAIYFALSILMVGIMIYLNWRRHASMIAIQLAALSYDLSYLVVGIACDFRYTYFSSVAALFGVAYLFISGRAGSWDMAGDGRRVSRQAGADR